MIIKVNTPGPAIVLAKSLAAAVDELIADAERKRLNGIRAAVEVEFAGAESEQDVAEKLAQLKEARNP